MKGITKETGLAILIFAAVFFITTALLYKFFPFSKIIPLVEEYNVPDFVQEELDEISEQKNKEPLSVTYTVDSKDLAMYERKQSYKPGKSDPFSELSTSDDEESLSGDQKEDIKKINDKLGQNTIVTIDQETEGGYYESGTTK